MHWTLSSPDFINEETSHVAIQCQGQRGYPSILHHTPSGFLSKGALSQGALQGEKRNNLKSNFFF